MQNVRDCILLGIPITCPFETLASSSEVVLLLEINLADLLLPICCLPEATALGEVDDSLGQCLDSDYIQRVGESVAGQS